MNHQHHPKFLASKLSMWVITFAISQGYSRNYSKFFNSTSFDGEVSNASLSSNGMKCSLAIAKEATRPDLNKYLE